MSHYVKESKLIFYHAVICLVFAPFLGGLYLMGFGSLFETNDFSISK